MDDNNNIIEEKLKSLTETSVWTFAKQDTNFENVFKATCIFDSIPDISSVNVEKYFSTYSLPDGFSCNHRMLSSAQLFGLLTKNYSTYSKEVVTPVFRELKKYRIGSDEFNSIKSEQLLKIKIGAIIDRSDNLNDHQILPIFFIFDVLYKLHELGIESISMNQLYTYVMTCSRYEDVTMCVECLKQDPPSSPLAQTFAGNCRMWTLITNNSKLFSVSNSRVSINPNYIEFFHTHFYMNKNNVIESVLNSILGYPDAYKAALTTVQGFNIDLTDDSPKEYIERRVLKNDFEKLPLQQIFYGAPGTGKSHEIKQQTIGCSVVRTTFHPDSDYSTFVGAYKPTMSEVDCQVVPVVINNGISLNQNQGTYTERRISYQFVKQAFLKAYLGAWKKYTETDGNIDPQFLIIEEINRGNCAQIFGDLFQLLDRANNGFSEYPIEADTDLQKEIERAFSEDYKLIKDIQIEGAIKDYISNYNANLSEDVQKGRVLLLPPNFFIWATMNTSDQSLFPIDSAFKRRWDWKYVKITEGKDENGQKLNWTIDVQFENSGDKLSWWAFIEKINEIIASMTSSADKQLGYFFCKAKNGLIDKKAFVSKVIFYLWNDVFKDYGFEDTTLFRFKNSNGEEKDLTYPDFYDIEGEEVNVERLTDFLKKVMNWKKNNDNN